MTYQAIFFENANEFLEHTLQVLAGNETRNNLILGLALRLKNDPHAYSEQEPLMAIVSGDHGIIGALAIMTPPFPMIVHSEPVNQEALEILADALLSKEWLLSGVNGVAEASDAFAQTWREKTGQEVRLLINLRAYELQKVEDIDYPPGAIRVAEEGDAQKAADMLRAMQEELKLQASNSATLEGALKSIRLKRTFFWVVDKEVVGITIVVRPQIKGICISGVFTPPEYRRKGYARALVAEVSKEMLSRGYEFANLFTDLANPTSNKIYQEIGYRPVCDYHQYEFL